MYAVSGAFKAAIRQSHKISVRAEVWRGGEFIRSLEPLDGSVDIDSRRAQRRTCTVKVAASRPGVDYQPVYTTYAQIAAGQPGYSTYAALKTDFLNYAVLSEVEGYTETATDDGLIPQTALSDLAPFGNELVLWRGVELERDTYRTYASLKTEYSSYGAWAAQSNAAPTVRTNLVTNPSFEVNTFSWSSMGGSPTRITSEQVYGSAALQLSYGGTGTTAGIQNSSPYYISVTAGQSYVYSAYIKQAAASGNVIINVMWIAADGLTLVQDGSHTVVTPTTSWQRASQTVTCPVGATFAVLRIYQTSGEFGGASAATVYVDGILFETGTTLRDYFDGTSYGGTSNVYQLDWNGTANSSTSTLTDWGVSAGTYGRYKQPIGAETITEEVPLGVFVITDVDVADSPAGKTEINIQGVDRSIKVAKASWVDPLVISNGTNVATAISSIVSNRFPSATFNFLSTSASVTGIALGLKGGQSNPWQDAQRLAESAGLDLYFDGNGTCVLRELPNPSEVTPVESYEEGADNLLLTATRRISSDNTFNGVIVTGEGSRVGTPVRAAVFDEDPASPTYRYGLFGDRPFFLSTPTVTTSAAAAVAAAAKLSTLKGAEENVEWTQVCDPSLDVNDVITVSNTGTRLNKVLVLDRLSVPLGPGQTMTAVARTVRSLATAY